MTFPSQPLYSLSLSLLGYDRCHSNLRNHYLDILLVPLPHLSPPDIVIAVDSYSKQSCHLCILSHFLLLFFLLVLSSSLPLILWSMPIRMLAYHMSVYWYVPEPDQHGSWIKTWNLDCNNRYIWWYFALGFCSYSTLDKSTASLMLLTSSLNTSINMVQVERVSHRDTLQSFVQKSENLEKQCLLQSIKSYCELRVLPYQENKTLVFWKGPFLSVANFNYLCHPKI